MDRWLEFLKRFFLRGHFLEESLFNDLDLRKFLERSLTLCLEQSSADEVIWISHDEYEKLRHHKHGEDYEEAQNLSLDLKIFGTKDVDIAQLMKNLSEFDMDSASTQIHDTKILMPIASYDGKTDLGHWLVLGIPRGKASKAALNLSKLVARISKHFGFCVEHQKAKEESFLDDLTGLYNQRYLSICVENEIHRCSRDKSKFSVLFMDIDFFKNVNDSKGHWVGSRLLVELSHVVAQHTRRSDYCFRYGGDEFVVLLSVTDKEGALIAAERIRKEVEATDFIVDGNQFNITLSIGIATYPDHADSHKEIIQMADHAMYCGKNKSRNIVFMAS